MRAATIPAVTLMVLAALVAGTEPAKPQAASSLPAGDLQPFQISYDLNLVVLPTSVVDKKGGFATDLTEHDFHAFENGAPVAIRLFRHDDTPVTVGLVVDHSGSMRNKLAEVIGAAHTFVNLSNPMDQMFVVNFSDTVSLGLPATVPFSDRADELQLAIEQIPAAGQTSLYDAISFALDRLKAGDREKKVLLVVSDGGDTASKLEWAPLLKKATESEAVIYTVGIFDTDDPDKNPDVLRKLSRATGGEACFPEKVDDVIAVCERIASDIRHQYTIGYYSGSAAKPGKYRSVRVVAQLPGRNLIVRTRTGFVTKAGSK